MPRNPKSKNTSSVDMIVAGLEGGPFYTISQASEITAVPIDTLRSWYKRGPNKGGTQAPSKTYKRGGLVIHLYTEDDLTEIRTRRGAPTVEDRKTS